MLIYYDFTLSDMIKSKDKYAVFTCLNLAYRYSSCSLLAVWTRSLTRSAAASNSFSRSAPSNRSALSAAPQSNFPNPKSESESDPPPSGSPVSGRAGSVPEPVAESGDEEGDRDAIEDNEDAL